MLLLKKRLRCIALALRPVFVLFQKLWGHTRSVQLSSTQAWQDLLSIKQYSVQQAARLPMQQTVWIVSYGRPATVIIANMSNTRADLSPIASQCGTKSAQRNLQL